MFGLFKLFLAGKLLILRLSRECNIVFIDFA